MSEIEGRIDPGSLRKLVQASRTWDKVSRREMRKGLRAAASLGAVAAQASVRGETPGGASAGASTGLRAGLARGVKVSIRTGRMGAGGIVTGEGVRVVAGSSALTDSKAPMVKAYMSKEWRHPVFGMSDTYVSQTGKDWFNRPLFSGRLAYQRAVVHAIEKASKAITD